MLHFGLIGYPLIHSFSKKYFTNKFKEEKIEADYELIELKDLNELKALIARQSFSGLNVTIPYKEKIIPFLDDLDSTASEIGAVNVIKFIRSGERTILKGFNTDVIGFSESVAPFLKPYHSKALILGTGGVSKSIEYALRKLGIEVTFVSRNPKSNQLSYTDLDESILQNHLIIINATPVGMFPHANECPNIPYEFLTPKHLLFDTIYNPVETLFLQKGKQKGATVLNGEKMLVIQAEESWKIWNKRHD
jgi:shikimate dehydrogenase